MLCILLHILEALGRRAPFAKATGVIQYVLELHAPRVASVES